MVNFYPLFTPLLFIHTKVLYPTNIYYCTIETLIHSALESEEAKDYYGEIQKLLIQIGVPQKESLRPPSPEKLVRQKSARSQSPVLPSPSSKDEIDNDRSVA